MIGIQQTQQSLNTLAGNLANTIDAAMTEVAKLNAYLGNQPGGAVAFLVGLGATNADATAYVAAVGNLATLAGAYTGANAITPAEDIQALTILLTGGQGL